MRSALFVLTLSSSALLALLALVALEGCKSCRRDPTETKPAVAKHEERGEREGEDEDEDEEEEEEKDKLRDHYWRATVTIVGQGSVRTFLEGGIDCTRDATKQAGICGPKLFVTKELAPPTLKATGAKGWKFDHWEARVRAPDGGVASRTIAEPTNRLYLDGFGYEDTGESEEVTATFVIDPTGVGDDDAPPDAALPNKPPRPKPNRP